MTKLSFVPLAAAIGIAMASTPAAAVVYSNPTPIVILDNDDSFSDITIAGTTGTITNLTLSLAGLSHTYPDDLLLGLINADAGLGFIFMSFAGGSIDISGVNLTFSDAASSQLPQTFVSPFPITSGTYLPSNFGGYTFTFYDNATSFAGFNGLSANGTWTLLVADTFAADVGTVAGGWSLDITTSAGAIPEPASSAMMIAGFGLVGASARRRRTTHVTA
ncbi:PEPxxWA-CTERM sorting domain-containing protein [Polymorphobacter fuscus]|nr:PEPxxWA-CTERM sorting domain-containing protein [Polymorphobacter fuscus]